MTPVSCLCLYFIRRDLNPRKLKEKLPETVHCGQHGQGGIHYVGVKCLSIKSSGNIQRLV